MADAIGVYIKSTGIETGGTNALTGFIRGGSRLSTGDAESLRAVLSAMDVVYTLYYKVEDSTTFDDLGNDTVSTISAAAPTGTEICAIGNGTYASSISLAAANGAFKPFYIKRTLLSASTPNLTIDPNSSVTFKVGSRVGQVTIFAASNGNTQSVLTWDAITGEASFEIERCEKSTDPGTGSWAAETGYTLTTEVADAVTKTITGLTNDTKYWFRCRAVSATGAGAWSTADDATPTSVTTLTGTFYPHVDGTLDTTGTTSNETLAYWDGCENGNVTVRAGSGSWTATQSLSYQESTQYTYEHTFSVSVPHGATSVSIKLGDEVEHTFTLSTGHFEAGTQTFYIYGMYYYENDLDYINIVSLNTSNYRCRLVVV
jgi:hypothetical protein